MEYVQPRIGDAERDEAVRQLQEHHAQGRLDLAEFDERMNAALKAKTQSDLEPLFLDLPKTGALARVEPDAPVPVPAHGDQESAAAATPDKDYSGAIQGGLWMLWLGAMFAFGWQYWWVIFIIMGISGIIQAQSSKRRNDQKAVNK